ncbi:MAG: shikimate dehydrogenase [Candidatus Obscuribacterales bacterium]|nr:shikimate dehydrogenase [Candidatus Obscuribacterales bacterium]
MSLRLGLIGHPVKHSLSPLMHQAALAWCGLSGSYELLDVEPENLDSTILSLKDKGFAGVNITIPHKEKASLLIPNKSAEVELVGAANTIKLEANGELSCHNTDLGGFIKALASFKGSEKGDHALILGSGGAARACLYGLALSGYKQIDLLARNQNTAVQLAGECQQKLADRKLQINVMPFAQTDFTGDLIVNCTPLGLSDSDLADSLPDWLSGLFTNSSKQCLFLDTVYRKDRSATALTQAAEKAGLRARDGRSMLAEQARLAFVYWTGKQPPLSIFLDALSDKMV